MHLGIKAKQIGGVSLIVGLAVVVLSAAPRHRPSPGSCSGRRWARADLLAEHDLPARRGRGGGRRPIRGPRSPPTAASGRSSSRADSPPTSPTRRSATWTAWPSRRGPRTSRASGWPAADDLNGSARRGQPAAARRHLLVGRRDARGAQAAAVRGREVRHDPDRRVHAAGSPGVEHGVAAGRPREPRGAPHRRRGLGVVRAVDAQADSRDQQRTDAPRPRRIRRPARPAAAGRVRRAGQLLQRGQRPAVRRPPAAGRLAGGRGRATRPRGGAAQLLAQAGRARPADRGRRARGEEPAECDDHPPRAAASRS